MTLMDEKVLTNQKFIARKAMNGLQKESAYQNTGVLTEEDAYIDTEIMLTRKEVSKNNKFKTEIVWMNVIIYILGQVCGIYVLHQALTGKIPLPLFLSLTLYSVIANFSITGGAHRLWAHRGYKAKLPLRILFLILDTLCVQNSVYEWVRDHRVHHKFTETNADPHNIKRGFFFAHVGWLLCKKHPDVKEKGKTVDLSDLESDPLIMWQHKYYPYLALLGVFLFPCLLSKWVSPNTTWTQIILLGAFGRLAIALNFTWLVNSWAHKFGSRPYDKNIDASDSLFVGIAALGEGWHNYHHVFPWDYKTSELGFYHLNLTTAVIDFFAKIGWAYDLKTVPQHLIKGRVLRTGDGSHAVWGWDDKDMSHEDIKITRIINGKQ